MIFFHLEPHICSIYTSHDSKFHIHLRLRRSLKSEESPHSSHDRIRRSSTCQAVGSPSHRLLGRRTNSGSRPTSLALRHLYRQEERLSFSFATLLIAKCSAITGFSSTLGCSLKFLFGKQSITTSSPLPSPSRT